LNHFSVEWFAKLDTQTTRKVSAIKKINNFVFIFEGNQEVEFREGFKSYQRASVVSREIETAASRQERRAGEENTKFGEHFSFPENN
jgi:hypothetical protein